MSNVSPHRRAVNLQSSFDHNARLAYPSKTARLFVAFAPGGGAAILGRQIARKLGVQFGRQVIVDNKPGGGTVIGTDFVATWASDGYTRLMQINALAANHTLFARLPYDTLRDFAPVVLIASTPNVLVVHSFLPVKTVKKFVARARPKPGEIAYASSDVVRHVRARPQATRSNPELNTSVNGILKQQ